MAKRIKIILITLLIISVILGLLYYFGIRPRTVEQIKQETTNELQKISDETKKTLPFPNEPVTDSVIDYEEVSLEPLIVGELSSGNKIIEYNTKDFSNVYFEKIERKSQLELGLFTAESEVELNSIVLIQDNKTGISSFPKKIVSKLLEFDFKNVKYWLFQEPDNDSLFVSLENFENPREVLIAGQPLNVFDIKQTKNQSTQFYFTTAGVDGNTKLVSLDFDKIPFDKWANLDFLDTKLDAIKLENSVDKEKLDKEIEENLQEAVENQDDILEYHTEFTDLRFYVVENGKVLVQVPGVVNQFWLVYGEKINLVKLDVTFDSGEGFITCKALDNVCVAYFQNVGIYKLDLKGDEPKATNIEPKIRDKGDGVFDANFIRSSEILGFDSEKLLEYVDNKVYFWFDGGKFILGEF